MATERDSVGTVEDLHASASKVTGLDDFGADEHVEGLKVLLESYEREARLTPAGNKATRAFLRGALAARALSEQAWRRHPEHADVAVERPIFVTGLPRTGTTALHRLLAVDPAHQGIEAWLAAAPQPRPPRETWGDDPVFRSIQDGYRQHRVEHPEFVGVHYMAADEVEECWQLLRQSVMSVSYECLAHVPSYSAWLARQDWTEAYRRHRRNLQLIGLADADRRWVLKNPSHLFALDELLTVYPDAIVLQTHRDPHTAMASMCSLSVHAAGEWSEGFHGERVGRDQLDLWARGLAEFREARARHERQGRRDQFYDIGYDDFVTDPIGTVRDVYERFSLPWTDEAFAAMRRLVAGSARGPAPAHRYQLADFGITAEEVDARFAP